MAIRETAAKAAPSYRAGAFALAVALGGILAALGFEVIGGYDPCPLCLMQRWAYYAGAPALFAALVAYIMGRTALAVSLFAMVALAFLANAGLGIYHVGVEQKLWLGPDTCSAVLRPIGGGAGGVLDKLPTARVARCDEAPWRMLGLSFAGWNVVVSALVAIAAIQAAVAARRA
jgi:disulfide bond formation protein DsbB